MILQDIQAFFTDLIGIKKKTYLILFLAVVIVEDVLVLRGIREPYLGRRFGVVLDVVVVVHDGLNLQKGKTPPEKKEAARVKCWTRNKLVENQKRRKTNETTKGA